MWKNKIWKRIFSGLLLIILWCSLAGCGKEEGISLEEITDDAQTEQDSVQKKEADDKEDSAKTEKDEDRSETDFESGVLSVYVCGAVHTPGVYELPAGSRLYQAVDAAGGMLEDADQNYLNLAMELTDGMKLQVPTKEEALAGTVAGEWTEIDEQMFGERSADSKETDSGTAGLVNINTADAALLMTLPGIGEAKAKSIIAYREEKGAFKKIEDIMNITGIKQAVYDKIKSAICVN